MYGNVIACPLCGKLDNANIRAEHKVGYRMWCDNSSLDSPGKQGCGAQTGAYKTAVEAVDAWNTRTVPDAKIAFNLNDYVWIKLTEVGHACMQKEYDKLSSKMGWDVAYTPPKEDDDGWSKWQLHEVMHQFGHLCWNGSNVPFETTMRLGIKEIKYG